VDARTPGRLFERLRQEGVDDLRRYLDDNPEAIELAKDSVVVTAANEGAIELFGARDMSALLRPVRFLYEATPEAARRVMIARFQGKRNHIEEMKVLTLDGRLVDILLLVTYPAEGEILDTTLLMMLDVSARVDAEARLRKMQADFTHAARLSTLGELVTSIAHEVKQPLATIATNGETSLRRLSGANPDLGKVAQLTTRIVESAQTASDVIDRIRSMARKREVEWTSVDLNTVVRQALLFVHHEMEGKAIVLGLDLDNALPSVCGDFIQLQQVLVNLLVNSIQAVGDRPTDTRRIMLKTETTPDGFVSFEIQDTGPGIEDSHRKLVFESFFTTKHNGLGIGLSICHSIVMDHGGAIAFSNHPDGGAVFKISIPVETAPAS
jgi:C4-dicarboxylate-specific signal transduction histidine kinase